MSIKLPDILLAQATVPAQLEAKQPALPKLSSPLMSFANALPKGPVLPLDALAKPPAIPGLGTPPAGGTPGSAFKLPKLPSFLSKVDVTTTPSPLPGSNIGTKVTLPTGFPRIGPY